MTRAPSIARVACAAACLVLSSALAPGALAQSEPIRELDRIVAVVNDDVIVHSELEAMVQTTVSQLRQQGTTPPPDAVLRRQVLERLIYNRLQVQLAEKSGVRIDDDTLNRTMTRLAGQNDLSLRQFRDILERDGYDFAKFREEIRKELLITEIRQRFVENRVNVSDRDLENYLATLEKQGGRANEYHIAQILVALPEGASADEIAAARARVESIQAELRDGADFTELAVARSDGQQALEGGDLGWRRAQDLPTIFAEAVPALGEGDVSEPLRSPSGFHLVKVLEIRGEERHVITQTRARHILVKTDALTDEDGARTRLEQLKLRIEGGDDFATLARSNSADAGSAQEGGDIGWVSPGDTVPEFEQVMAGLAPGEVSEPFESRYGWHIVQVLERREFDDTEQVRRAEAREQLRQRKVEEEMQSWLRQMRDEAYVEYRLDE